MKTIEEMLRALARTDVSEFAIVSDRLPCIKVAGQFQPVDDVAPDTDAVLQMLVAVGGSRYVDALGPKPLQWSTRVDGVGIVLVTAMMRDDVVQARFAVQQRLAAGATPRAASPQPAAQAIGAPRAAATTQTSPHPAGHGAAPPSGHTRRASNAGLELDIEPRRPSAARTLSAPPPPLAVPAPAAAAAKVAAEPQFELDVDTRNVTFSGGAVQTGTVRDFDFEPGIDPTPLGPAEPTVQSGYDALEIDPFEERRAPSAPAAAYASSPPGAAHVSSRPMRAAARAVDPVPSPLPPPTPPHARYDARYDGSAAAPRATTAVSVAPPPPPTTRVAATSVRELAELLAAARATGASDLHVLPSRPPLFRIGGELIPRGQTIDAPLVERVVHGMVPPRLAEILDRDGSCDFALQDETGRSRVNVTKQRTGYKVCVRLIAPHVPTLASLGLPESIGKATHHHQGLILVTGPTGHGKTSTLAAIVDLVNTNTTHHVITVEDPVEYVHPRKRAMMSQREVGTHTKTFAAALKGALREDPDVIVVGELRDTETVRMALAASETGHLVIGTMNTPSAAKTIDRLIDLFPPGDQAQVRLTLAGGLRLVVSQRLLPSADGRGLVAAAELLPGSISLWNLIRDNKTYQIPSLQQRGKALGIVRLDDSLAELVKAGRTTLDFAKQYADAPDELEAIVSGKRAQQMAQLRPPEAPKPSDAREGGGLLGKAGNLFRKG